MRPSAAHQLPLYIMLFLALLSALRVHQCYVGYADLSSLKHWWNDVLVVPWMQD